MYTGPPQPPRCLHCLRVFPRTHLVTCLRDCLRDCLRIFRVLREGMVFILVYAILIDRKIEQSIEDEH